MAQHEEIEKFLDNTIQYAAPEALRSQGIPPWEKAYEEALDGNRYWDQIAQSRTWLQPYTRVTEGQWPQVRWFLDGVTNITLDCLDRHINEGRGDLTAYIALTEQGLERQLTYRELMDEVDRIARGLSALGISRGDRVIIYMPLVWQGIVAMLAAARIGAIHSVVYAGLGSSALKNRIEQAEAKAVLTADVTYRRGKAISLLPIVESALKDVPEVAHTVILRRQPETILPPFALDWDQWFSQDHPHVPVAPMQSEDPLFILFTSGTTGSPKGAMFVHGGYSVGVPQLLQQAIAYQPGDIFWCMSDIGWIVGHSLIVYGPLISGMTTVIREGAPDYPQPDAVWDTIEQYHISKVYTAPTAVRMLRKFGEDYAAKHRLDSLKLVACAGEPLNPEAWRWLHDDVGHGRFAVVDNWWQTETAGPTIGTWPTMAAKPGKAGKPFPGVGARIVDEKGQDRPLNQGGALILTRPLPQMFRDVWGNHARYEEYFKTVPGSYLSGDVAVLDADGYFEMLGRADDVLNVAGHRIGTADVESALVSHPAVAEAAAVGVPDPLKGEAIIAYVLLRPSYQPDPEMETILIYHVRQELGPIATPSAIRFADKLPKTRSGKIMRRVVKAWELGQDPGDLTTLDD
ncbi:MAG: acetate--CoA ligase [Sulfobacillus benefaciens]|uniref:acetate--CoA ligase n=1 Tax=Sulfobacillus benefaciens TaxID=453960 RepID=A0A2T2XLJ7_9FIRM|nr:MAG: acetate--CoA ligase [Sulfobacillus benefaciens]